MKELTARQNQIFRWIKAKINRGVPPTVREVSERFGMSTNGAQSVMKRLVSKGYLRKAVRHQARNIRLTRKGAA